MGLGKKKKKKKGDWLGVGGEGSDLPGELSAVTQSSLLENLNLDPRWAAGWGDTSLKRNWVGQAKPIFKAFWLRF